MGFGSGVDDRRRTRHGHHGNGALVPPETTVHMVGLPGAYLFVLCDAHPEFGRQSDEVWVSGARVAVADVDQTQAQSPSDGGVGAIDDAWAHGRCPEVDPCLLGDGSVYQNNWRFGMA